MWNPYVYQNQPNPGFAGYGYAAPQPAPVLNNFLTPEQIAEIQQNPQLFPTKLTRDEYLRSVCTHKQNNIIALERTGDGNHHCPICNKDFFLFDLNTPEETIVSVCRNMYDLIQSIKTYLLNAPEALKDIYMVLGFIEKFPILWKTATKSFEQASNQTALGLQNNPEVNAFQMLGNMMGGGMPMGMMGGMQMPGNFYGQQPMGYPAQPAQAWQAGGYPQPQQPMTPPVAPQPQPQQPPIYTPSGYTIPQPGPVVTPQNPYAPAYPMQGPQMQAPFQAPPMGGNPISSNVEPPTPQAAAPQVNTDAVNPNLQTPEKVDVQKAFTPAA